MKKLMIATLAAAAVGGAFAAPRVYDYKASVKHTYEKESGSVYVKYVKSAKLQGYFVQDFDGRTPFAQTCLTGGAVSQKKGFLVLINKSAEKDYRAPKIMPAQIDVKALETKITVKGGTTKTKQIVEAYFYAGPFAAFPDTFTTWDASYDAGLDWLFNNGAAAATVGPRSYGTVGSTLYLFGQHNVANRCNNDPGTSYEPATVFRAFGDAWMNGAGFGTGGGKSKLCCNWDTGSSSFGSISGNLKGGLFLCSIPNRPIGNPAEKGWFTLGLEDVYQDDVGGAGIGRTVQGDLLTAEVADRKAWADGELVLSTTDVVSGSWTLKPSSDKFKPATLSSDEDAWFTANAPGYTAVPSDATVIQHIKAACQKLDKNYSLTTDLEAYDVFGTPTDGLVSINFATLYL